MLLAVRGFAVAMVEYRASEEAPFPAQALDAKAAIRFMKQHAAEYRVNPDRVVVMGDSSGGHTALMAGLTCGVPSLEEAGEAACSSAVRGVIDSYGPTDISKMNEELSVQDHWSPDSPEGCLIGGKNVLEHPELVAPTVPMYYLDKGVPTPPILIMHGDRDQLVAFNQSCRLYSRLRELGKEVEMYKLKGAYHVVGGFNSDEALDIVIGFIGRHMAD